MFEYCLTCDYPYEIHTIRNRNISRYIIRDCAHNIVLCSHCPREKRRAYLFEKLKEMEEEMDDWRDVIKLCRTTF